MRPILLNVQDVADELRASRATIYRLILLGRLRPIKLGNATRFRREDVEAFVKNLPLMEV